MHRIENKNNIVPDFSGTKEPFSARSRWRAKWITALVSVGAVRYTLSVELPSDTIVHLSASDRYILYCDGELVGRGPAVGSHSVWYYDSYAICKGQHDLCAVVYTQGEYRAWSQVSFGNRFILTSDAHNELLATGIAKWLVQHDARWSFYNSTSPQTGKRVGTSGRFIFNASAELPPASPALCLDAGYTYSSYDILPHTIPNLVPNRLPPMSASEHDLSLTAEIPPNSSREQIIALDNYYTAYPELCVSGGKGSKITIEFAESLYEPGSIKKGVRSETTGKEFRGIGDIYYTDGADTILTPLWWLAGRYIRISVRTGGETIYINSLKIRETHYPVSPKKLPKNNELITKLNPVLLRTLQMCMHESYMDCPHYEQLMYIGDTRIQMLICYAISDDTRLAEQSIELLASAVSITDGTLPCCYPCNNPRVIPGFSLYFAAILYDYLVHTKNAEFIKQYLGVGRRIIDLYLPESIGNAAKTPSGWNFYDWADGWQDGIPAEQNGICYEFNAHLIYTISLWAQVEQFFGESEYSARLIRYANSIKDVLISKPHAVSEHYLCFMLLSGVLSHDEESQLLSELLKTNGAQLSVYFSHYLFEVYRKFGLYDEMDKYLERWRFLIRDGFYTVPEEFNEQTRSDCHAWGAHPIYHYLMVEQEKNQKENQ